MKNLNCMFWSALSGKSHFSTGFCLLLWPSAHYNIGALSLFYFNLHLSKLPHAYRFLFYISWFGICRIVAKRIHVRTLICFRLIVHWKELDDSVSFGEVRLRLRNFKRNFFVISWWLWCGNMNLIVFWWGNLIDRFWRNTFWFWRLVNVLWWTWDRTLMLLIISDFIFFDAWSSISRFIGLILKLFFIRNFFRGILLIFFIVNKMFKTFNRTLWLILSIINIELVLLILNEIGWWLFFLTDQGFFRIKSPLSQHFHLAVNLICITAVHVDFFIIIFYYVLIIVIVDSNHWLWLELSVTTWLL